jgi:hypothetical protein
MSLILVHLSHVETVPRLLKSYPSRRATHWRHLLVMAGPRKPSRDARAPGTRSGRVLERRARDEPVEGAPRCRLIDRALERLARSSARPAWASERPSRPPPSAVYEAPRHPFCGGELSRRAQRNFTRALSKDGIKGRKLGKDGISLLCPIA